MNKELAVISAVYEDNDISALANVKPELFPAYADVQLFLLEYYQKHKSLPPKSLVEDKFAITMLNGVGATRHHIEELQNLYLNRRIREILRDAGSKVQNGELTAALNSMVTAGSTLKKDATNIRDLNAVDIDEAVEHLKRIQELNARGKYGVTFGIPGIDDFLPSGMVPGMFGLILGYPGRGKSFLTTLMAVRAWDRGFKPLYVSLEMTETEVRARVYAIAGEGRWSLRKLQRGDVTAEEFREWADARFEEKAEFPIVSNDGSGRFTPAGLRSKIEEYNPSIVFVDYLQLMAPDNGNDGNETVKLKTISTETKLVAMAAGVPVVGVVSATPSDASDVNSIPELMQIAWAKQLAYDADWVLAVGREDNSPLMAVAWRKNRNGPLTDWMLDCQFDRGIFTYEEIDFDNV